MYIHTKNYPNRINSIPWFGPDTERGDACDNPLLIAVQCVVIMFRLLSFILPQLPPPFFSPSDLGQTRCPNIQGWDMLKMHFFVGTASRLSILSTCLQTFRPCCPACATVRVENRSQKLERRVKLSLRKYLVFHSCLRVTTSCLIRQYLPYGPTTSKRGACWFFSCLHIIANTAQLIRTASKARLSF